MEKERKEGRKEETKERRKEKRRKREKERIGSKKNNSRLKKCTGYASVNSSSAHFPPGISGAFFLIVRPGGRALVYPGAFDGHVIFTSQHCHLLSLISSSGKDDKSVINFV